MVSVILVTHNQKYSLSRAIDSVLNQTIMRWEIIIVDDGSDDGTDDFIKSYFLLNKKIRYFKRTYKGSISAKNFGIKNSIGSFITFIDPPDEYKPNHLELRVKYLEENPEIDIIHGGIDIVYHSTSKQKQKIKEQIQYDLLDKGYVGATIFGRRKVFELLNGFHEVDSEDLDFITRAIEYFNIRKVDFPTYIKHIN